MNISELQDLALVTNMVDAAGTLLAVGSLVFPSNPDLAEAEQKRADKATGHDGTTIAQFFASRPITAMAQYGGNTIFYGPSFASFGSGYAVYTIFHEVFHLKGFGDAEIERAMGITPGIVAVQGSQSVTNKLMEECGK